MWRELWFTMAEGKKSEYDRIKATDVLEFWALYDLWKQQNARQRDEYAARSRNAKRK